jgi:Kae1-associated kinase Bud32
MEMKLIAQGAESKLFRDDDQLIKKRVKKSYRIKELDEFLRKHRTRVEARMLRKAGKIISVPKLVSVKDYEISMKFIDAPVLRDLIPSLKDFDKVMSQVGRAVAKLHSHNIIHGDLTTSNMIVKDSELFLIDFGLSESSTKVEARAVDLHVLKQALKSKHYKEFKKAWRLIKESYVENYSKGDEVLKRLKVVEGRGRYKNKTCI